MKPEHLMIYISTLRGVIDMIDNTTNISLSKVKKLLSKEIEDMKFKLMESRHGRQN